MRPVGGDDGGALRRAHRRRHQPRPRSGGGGGPLPRGPLLPPQRHRHRAAAAARARQRRAAAGPALRRALRRAHRQARAGAVARPAAQKLLAYGWPGNVRELQNCIERAVALTRFEQLTVEDLPEKRAQLQPRRRWCPRARTRRELVPLEEVERRYILRVLEAVGGSQHAGRADPRARPQDALPQAPPRRERRARVLKPGPPGALRPHYTFAVRAVHLPWRTGQRAPG